MFYDERIEGVRGRVCRNAMAIALPFSAVTVLFRLLTLLSWRDIDVSRYRYLIATDASVLLGVLSVLLIGALRGIGQIKDEMWQSRQAAYYRRAAGLLLRLLPLVWAWFLPHALAIGAPLGRMTVAYEALFPVLLFVLGAYAVCSFRKQDVYFNYAALEQERYARAVWRNLGRVGLLVVGCFMLSFISLIGLMLRSQISRQLLPVSISRLLISYGVVAISVAVLYLLLSYLEWASFHRKRVISTSSNLCLISAVSFYALYTLLVGCIDVIPVTQATKIALVNYAAYLHTPVRMLLLLFLSYFAYEYRKVSHSNAISHPCCVMIVTCGVRVSGDLLRTCLVTLHQEQVFHSESWIVRRMLVTFNITLNTLESLGLTLGFVWILSILIRHRRLGSGHIAAILALALAWGVGIFLSTQTDTLQLTLYRSLISAALLIYACIVFLCIRWESQANADADCPGV